MASFGLGQMLIGGLIGSQLGKGGLLGSDDEDKTIKSMGEYNQPQAQPQPQAQGGGVFGGIGGMVSGISNQLFDGMSQEQVARLGMGFNSMRLNPSDNMAANFQSTIDNSIQQKKATQITNDTISYLQNAVTKEFPNGRTDLISMLQKGLITPTKALDIFMKGTTVDPLTMRYNKYDELVSRYGSPEKIPSHELQILGINNDEELFIKKYEYYKEQGGEASYEDYMKMNSPGTVVTIGGEDTPYPLFWQKLDEKATEDYQKWVLADGRSDVYQQIASLTDVVTDLENGVPLTGPAIGMLPDWFLAFASPDTVGQRQAVEQVVQRNLRLILGAQFAQKEGELLIARAYDPKLPIEINAQKLNLLLKQMIAAANTKDSMMEHLREFGTLMNWEGQEYNMQDFHDLYNTRVQKGDIRCYNNNGKKECYMFNGGNEDDENNYTLQPGN